MLGDMIHAFKIFKVVALSRVYALTKSSQVAQSCPALCDRMDCSLPGSSVHGIFQARVLEWVAICSHYQGVKVPLFHFLTSIVLNQTLSLPI